METKNEEPKREKRELKLEFELMQDMQKKSYRKIFGLRSFSWFRKKFWREKNDFCPKPETTLVEFKEIRFKPSPGFS